MRLAVAVFLEVTALLFVFDDIDFRVAADFRKGGIHGGAGNVRGADSGIFSIVHKENFVKSNAVPDLVRTGDFLNPNNISHGDLVLLAACLYDRKFHPVVKFQVVLSNFPDIYN